VKHPPARQFHAPLTQLQVVEQVSKWQNSPGLQSFSEKHRSMAVVGVMYGFGPEQLSLPDEPPTADVTNVLGTPPTALAPALGSCTPPVADVPPNVDATPAEGLPPAAVELGTLAFPLLSDVPKITLVVPGAFPPVP
jgi:hypothetical protein